MNCPMFVDYTRNCLSYARNIAEINTHPFCSQGKYADCPFYRLINGIEPVCENMKECVICSKISYKNFDKFLEYTKTYCLSKNKIDCERFKIRSLDKIPPVTLMPDGNHLEDI
ncbi:MAG: hypothetical protein ABII88_09135 [Candidatus Omnitrophota bacterium]